MKKIITAVGFLFCAGIISAQSQRLVLAEEFTQASCPPCASQNPGFNALLGANTSKITSIKYQTDWPGVDPMNAQNPGEVTTRVAYYGVTGVPYGKIDGVEIANDCGSYAGAPACLNQAEIDAEYAVPSPFTIQLKHWFNAANDSIFIYCEITASQNITMTTPKLQVGMIEKTITFATAPGSNGEKVFEHVMRKMYPNAGGTTLPTTWTNGQKKVITFQAKIPSYIYSKPQIGVVAWVQDNSDKSVKQAGESLTASAPLPLAPVADFATGVTTSCDGIFKFQDLSALLPTYWQWDFGDGTNSYFQNPTHKYGAAGTYAVQLTAGNANGTNSVTKTGYVTVTLSGTAPTGVNDNICSNGVANLSATPAGSGTLNWYNNNGAMINTGNTYSPNVIGTTDFWVAEMTANPVKNEGAPNNTMGTGASYTASATQGLIFDVLKPCKLISVAVYAGTSGNRTIQVLDAGGSVVQTATVNCPVGLSTVTLNFSLDPGTGYVIKPSTLACNLYRNTAGAVYPYAASGLINITGSTAAGSPNYYYFFYDWKVQQNPCASPAVKVSALDTCTSTGINDVTVTNSLVVYPNPGNGVFTTSFNATVNANYSVKISNTLGQVVYEESLSSFIGNYSKEINIASYGKGVYMLSISNGKNADVKKVITF